jgi:hypothetical protein
MHPVHLEIARTPVVCGLAARAAPGARRAAPQVIEPETVTHYLRSLVWGPYAAAGREATADLASLRVVRYPQGRSAGEVTFQVR